MLDLNREEIKIFKRLNTPRKIQDFLEAMPVNFEPHGDTCMSPRRVLHEYRSHCIEGAFLAAAVLWYHGEKPLLLDLKSADHDYDHVVALYRSRGRWGALSKTNHAVLRYREPVYHSVRELAMSYFHEYFLDDGRKTMRSFSRPFDLSRLGHAWVTAPDDLWDVAVALDDSPHVEILASGMARRLRPADPLEIRAGKLTQHKKLK